MDTALSAPVGQLLDGRYLVESQIARGGMATVYIGRDVRLDRPVALKIAHPELARDQEFADRFIGEARAVARLSSPNVVAVFDQGSVGDLHFIAMEYVPGPTLRELLVARGRLSPREALDIIERVLAGLAVAHEAGIVHRDVKPENVLLGNGRSVKVADFGLARAASGISHTRTGVLIGTAAYLAPEQVASNTSDQRSDVYAAGVMLFEMLTGAQPHTGETPLAVAYKHVHSVVPAPSSLVSDLPSALDALVTLATSRDPDLRPPDARHYLQAITEVRRGMPVPTMPHPGQLGQAAEAASGSSAGRNQPPGEPAAGIAGSLGAAAARRQVGHPTDLLPSATERPPDANRTMIVPTDDRDADLPGGRLGGHRSRHHREPVLQRWLFSRRILIVLAVLLLAAAGWWLAAGRYVAVPSVAGRSVAVARSILRDDGLTVVSAAARHSDTVPAGRVIATEPAGGSRITHGGKVTIIPSLGPVMVTMPAVTGQQLGQAEQTLRTAGLTPGSPTYQTSTSIPQGVVISTNAVAYQPWPKDEPVQLVVSSGQPLPDFVGQQLSAAQAAAAGGGYSIQQQTVSNSTQPQGTVLNQSPKAGTPVTSGEVVTVWISAGPPGVAVPNVDGLNAQQAIQVLRGAGFGVNVVSGLFGSRVTNYSPQGSAPAGSTITITIGFNL
jgi:eukaryotic-like serine/threonine-protein kinase